MKPTSRSSGVQVELTEKDLAPLHAAIRKIKGPNPSGDYFNITDWEKLIPLGRKVGEPFEQLFTLLSKPR